MSSLSPIELRKYEYRIPTFLERLASGTFITTSNTEVRLTFQGEGLEERLRNDSSRAVGKLQFTGEDGVIYRLSDLQKDAGFGGKGAGATLKREDEALSLFRQKIDIEKFNNASDSIPVVINGSCYYVANVVSTVGTPKSDFHFTDVEGNEIAWMSHKHGKTPRCFQQWGGCSARNEPNINTHEETRSFIERIRELQFRAGFTIAMSIRDPHLQNLAVYGNEYGGTYGQNNVHLVIQGLPSLCSNTANVHFDIVSHSVHNNGELLPDGYAPTFMAMYRGDRRDFGIETCRVGISPKKARLISDWIENEES